MLEFPSRDWFQAAADLLNGSDSFDRLGNCDADIGVQVGDHTYEIVFDGFEITAVNELAPGTPADLDFTLVQSPEDWRAMLEDIRANGRATGQYTLNSLDLRSEVEFARGDDYHRRDTFYRFNQTFQEFFDNTARLDYAFVEPAPA